MLLLFKLDQFPTEQTDGLLFGNPRAWTCLHPAAPSSAPPGWLGSYLWVIVWHSYKKKSRQINKTIKTSEGGGLYLSSVRAMRVRPSVENTIKDIRSWGLENRQTSSCEAKTWFFFLFLSLNLMFVWTHTWWTCVPSGQQSKISRSSSAAHCQTWGGHTGVCQKAVHCMCSCVTSAEAILWAWSESEPLKHILSFQDRYSVLSALI